MSASIVGWGTAIPEGRITNADIEARGLDTNDDWIVERTGIRERRQAGPDETTATLATAAGAEAIKQAGLTASDIDLVIVATLTPDHTLPSASALVQDALGVKAGAFDLGAACSGWVYGFIAASSMVATGVCKHPLVIGSEVLTRVVNPMERGTAILFGDGAGATVLAPGDNLLSWDLGCDGSAAGILYIPAGGSKLPTTAETVANGDHWVAMEGREVFRRAVRVIADSVAVTLEKANMTPDDVDLFIPHQANQRIVDAALSRCGIPAEKTFMNVERYGNTSGASIPIALAEAAEAGRMHDGDTVLLTGFGAGMTWASALLRWGPGSA